MDQGFGVGVKVRVPVVRDQSDWAQEETFDEGLREV